MTFFSQYPQPPRRPEEDRQKEKLTAALNDDYLQSLEQYIDELETFIREVQAAEVRRLSKPASPVSLGETGAQANELFFFFFGSNGRRKGALYSRFKKQLESLKNQDPLTRVREESVNLRTFEANVAAVRERRGEYRRMLADALAQRSHMLDAMLIQKEQEDLVRAQLYKLRALPDHSSRERAGRARFSPFAILLAADQLIMLLVFALAVSFPNDTGAASNAAAAAQTFYSFYTDIALLVLVGLGFLMTFLVKYAYSALGFTLLLTAFTLQWTILVVGFFRQVTAGTFSYIPLTFPTLLDGMYGVVAILVSFGALAGKLSPFAMVVMAFWEVIFYGVNLYIGSMLLQASDYGYSFFVHVFGAVFGVAASLLVSRRYVLEGAAAHDEASDYASDSLAMLGTLVLWVFFPSLNAALVPVSAQARTALNTVLALAGGTTFAFCSSRLFHAKRFHMLDVQNATVAAGVAMASSASVVVTPGIGLLMGILGASVSVVCLTFLRPLMAGGKSVLRVHDTRGVLCVHGVPGFLAAISGIIATAIASLSPLVFGTPFTTLFPRPYAAGYQAAALAITLLLAAAGGLLTGLLIYFLDRKVNNLWFSDEQHWNVPSDFQGVEKLPKVTVSHLVRQ